MLDVTCRLSQWSPCGLQGRRWSTTSEQFYYIAWAFYCFANKKAAVLEDDCLFLSVAAALLEKTLFMQV